MPDTNLFVENLEGVVAFAFIIIAVCLVISAINWATAGDTRRRKEDRRAEEDRDGRG